MKQSKHNLAMTVLAERMAKDNLIKELIRLTSKTEQPEDAGIAGWQPVAANRIAAIRKLAHASDFAVFKHSA